MHSAVVLSDQSPVGLRDHGSVTVVISILAVRRTIKKETDLS